MPPDIEDGRILVVVGFGFGDGNFGFGVHVALQQGFNHQRATDFLVYRLLGAVKLNLYKIVVFGGTGKLLAKVGFGAA